MFTSSPFRIALTKSRHSSGATSRATPEMLTFALVKGPLLWGPAHAGDFGLRRLDSQRLLNLSSSWSLVRAYGGS